MPSWTTGRVALVGDAAHATNFHTGMGSSLAMQSATVLANALHENEDFKTAFSKYNETYGPYVKHVQSKLPSE